MDRSALIQPHYFFDIQLNFKTMYNHLGIYQTITINLIIQEMKEREPP